MQHAARVLDEHGLPNVYHYVRLHADDRWTDDLESLNDLRPGQRAVTAQSLARHIFGTGSEQDYAAQVIYDYRALRENIIRGDHEMAAYLAARLGLLIAQSELEPDANARGRSLQAATLTKQERARKAETRVRARAEELRARHPELSAVRIATLIRGELESNGDALDYLPSARTIRRYLKDK